jgi:transposase
MATSKDCTTHYPSDVSDEEWEFCVPYLTLMDPEAPQRRHRLRALFNALRYIAKTGVQWRYLPENFPPYHAVYQQAQRWIRAGVLEAMAK